MRHGPGRRREASGREAGESWSGGGEQGQTPHGGSEPRNWRGQFGMRMSTPGCVLVRIQIVTAAVAVAGGQRRGGRRQSTRCWGGGVWQGAGVRGGGHVDRHGRRRERRPSTSLAPTEAPRWALFGNDGRCRVAVGREVAATTAATTAAVAMSSHLRLREQTIDVANRAGWGGRMRTRWRRQRGGGGGWWTTRQLGDDNDDGWDRPPAQGDDEDDEEEDFWQRRGRGERSGIRDDESK